MVYIILIIGGDNGNINAANTMSFINGGHVDEITYNFNIYSYFNIEVQYKKSFITLDKDEKPYRDSRREGTISTESIETICKSVPDTFYKDIIDNAWDWKSYINDVYDSYIFKCVMEHFGQYEQAMEYIDILRQKKEQSKAKTNKSKTQKAKKDKLSSVKDSVAKMSKKEKEELLKMLMENN